MLVPATDAPHQPDMTLCVLPGPLPGPKLIPRSTAVYAVRAVVFHGVPGFTCHTPAKRLHFTIDTIFTPSIHELMSSFR